MSKKTNAAVVESLSKLLADSYVLLLKTQNYHWNVKGPHFGALHILFEGQYNELFKAIDEVAERIRALDAPTPGSFAAFKDVATIKEETGSQNAEQMLKNLANDNDTLAETAEAVIKAAEEVGDDATADMAIARVQLHQKNAWMLKSHLA